MFTQLEETDFVIKLLNISSLVKFYRRLLQNSMPIMGWHFEKSI